MSYLTRLQIIIVLASFSGAILAILGYAGTKTWLTTKYNGPKSKRPFYTTGCFNLMSVATFGIGACIVMITLVAFVQSILPYIK